MLKRTLSALSVLAILGAGCLGNKPPSTAQTPGESPTRTVSPIVLEGKSAINVDDQPVGNDVIVSFVQFEKSGYVVIHEDRNGVPGAILGNTGLLVDRNYENVLVSVKVENGKTYWAMIHLDEGNGTFDANEDLPARDSQNNVVMMSFKGSTDAGKTTEENPPKEATAPKTYTITIQSYDYSAKVLNVKKGDKIEFTNKDNDPHSATADNGGFDTGLLNRDESKVIDTSKLAPGAYPYHCTPHPFMKATIIVE